MTPLAIALALFAQDAEPAAQAPSGPPAAAVRLPTGAPRDDYQFVAWCYGAVRGYLEMHDEVMPEVTRIEKAFRRPGSKLEDDLKVYDSMQKASEKQLKIYQSALTAAEKASIKPLNAVGAQAVRQGRQIWATGPEVTTARKAQEWMGWTPPARCETVAVSLEQRAKLMGATFKVNQEPDGGVAPAPSGDSATPPAAS